MNLEHTYRFRTCCALVALFLFAAVSADSIHAATVIIAQEVGSDVVFVGSGTLDLTGLAIPDRSTTRASINPGFTSFRVGLAVSTPVDGYFNVFTTTPLMFGAVNMFMPADEGSGDMFGAGSFLVVPDGYVSGAPLSGSMTFRNETFESLGLAAGTYTWVMGPEQGFDTITLVIPEPRLFSYFVFSLFGLMLVSRRR